MDKQQKTLEELIKESMIAFPRQLQNYRTGQKALITFFMDDVLRRIRLQGSPIDTANIITMLQSKLSDIGTHAKRKLGEY